MSTPPPANDDHEGTLEVMWTKAIHEFERSSGKSLNNPSLLEIIGHDPTIDSIGKALDKCGAGLEKFRNRGSFVLNALKPLLDMMKAIVEPVGDIVQNAGVPGGKVMFVAVARLLEVIEGVSKRYDNLAEALIQIKGMLSRVKLLCDANAIVPVLRELCIQTLSQVLAIISSFIQYCEASRSKHKALTVRTKDLFASVTGRDSTLPAFTELRRLIDEGDKTVNVQTLAVITQIQKTQRLQMIYERITPTDSGQNQDERLQQGKVVPDHAKWLFSSEMFKGWLESSNGFFWVSANAGVGKSVICAEVIKHLQERSFSSKAAIAYHYFDYRVPNKRLYNKLLASIITHFSETSPECRKVLMTAFSQTLIPADVSRSKLEAVVKSMLATSGSKFLVIDALDECQKEDDNRKLLLSQLRTLTDNLVPWSGDLHIFTTSRPLPDIERALWHTPNKVVTHRLELGEQPDHHTTLKTFIKTKLNGEDFDDSDWSPSFKEGVASTLIEKSQSMFLWVQLQIELLKGSWQAEASHKLLDLPTSLAATYNRILDEIAVQHRKRIRVIIECVIAATAQGRALSRAEIQEMLRFEMTPASDKPKCLVVATTHQEDGVRATLAQGEGVDIFKYLPRSLFNVREGDSAFGFIHFTVQEYLVSDHDSKNDLCHDFRTSLRNARYTYLLVLLSALDIVNSPYMPNLRRYADESWYATAQSVLADDASITNTLEHFLNPNSQSFNDWVERRYKDLYLTDYRESDEAHSPHDHPIHWAVRVGSLDQVKRLCQLWLGNESESCSDVRNLYDSLNWTPLCWAAVCGNVEIFSLLLEGNTSWTDQHVGPFYGGREHQRETARLLDVLLCTKFQPLRIPHVNNTDATPLAWPLWSLYSLSQLHSQSATMVQVLLDGVTDAAATELLSVSDASGYTPLLRALAIPRYGEEGGWLLDVVRVLLSKGASPHAQNNRDQGIAHIACKQNAWILPALMAEIIIDVNISDKDGDTPLHVAAEWVMTEGIETLLKAGADPNKCNNNGDTALDIVVKHIVEYHDDPPLRGEEGWLEEFKKKRVLLEGHGAQLHSLAQEEN
ncbi:hypothetical protein DL93DRAFT_2172517 [Clavulina sp. PMI_390]|nr:hypothetical protein DL93DRAFT_2172517 [Clavulina sp. PMI_390]